jgi:hypothetical protein
LVIIGPIIACNTKKKKLGIHAWVPSSWNSEMERLVFVLMGHNHSCCFCYLNIRHIIFWAWESSSVKEKGKIERKGKPSLGLVGGLNGQVTVYSVDSHY